jgi:hypothetical protein
VTRRVNPWPVWLITVTATFAALETRALTHRDIPTLSENLARWGGTYPRRRHGSLVPVAFLAGAAWLTVHVSSWGGAKELQR